MTQTAKIIYIDGMTLRDWFAGQALANPMTYGENYQWDDIAMRAYFIADAMMEEREVQP